MEETQDNEPYLIKIVQKTIRLYNHNYGDNRMCVCGHPYHRHFDGFEEPEHQAVGCKYCSCYTFVEKV